MVSFTEKKSGDLGVPLGMLQQNLLTLQHGMRRRSAAAGRCIIARGAESPEAPVFSGSREIAANPRPRLSGTGRIGRAAGRCSIVRGAESPEAPVLSDSREIAANLPERRSQIRSGTACRITWNLVRTAVRDAEEDRDPLAPALLEHLSPEQIRERIGSSLRGSRRRPPKAARRVALGSSVPPPCVRRIRSTGRSSRRSPRRRSSMRSPAASVVSSTRPTISSWRPFETPRTVCERETATGMPSAAAPAVRCRAGVMRLFPHRLPSPLPAQSQIPKPRQARRLRPFQK
jgi:hypothetical protein